MKKIDFLVFFILFFFLISTNLYLYSERTIDLNVKRILDIGKDELMFSSITSVYEDKDENFYVLDKKASKVYKFAPEGNLLLSFGDKGRGPGDFVNPYDLYVSDTGEIVVSEESSFVSFFDKNGKFIKRLVLNRGLALTYLNDDLYYGWIWETDKTRQILIDSKSKTLKSFFTVLKDSFSISLPDETGRMVMFNYSLEEYTPFLLFSRYQNHSAIGVGNNYEILILNKEGMVISKIKRDIKPQRISSKEKQYFIKEIRDIKKWPYWVIKKIEKKIPKVKSYFGKILISEKYVFVFRIKRDVTDEHSPVPVDIFTISGEFLGSSKINTKPLFISDKYLYISEMNDNDDLILIKFRYQLTGYK